jgi:hypothetical protein
MRIRFAALALAAVSTAGCADAIATFAPRVFYGYVTSVDDTELCVGDARQGEPDRTRCFGLNGADVTHDVEEGSLVRVAYDRQDDRDVATSVERHGRE